MAIIQHKDRPLNIYRASAGSGKTHLLTGFYLKLLFARDLLPETHSGEMRFNEILAVTFTNKATGEMKGRIIDQLFLLSQDPTESDYWSDIAPCFTDEDLGSEEVTRRVARAVHVKATQLLIQILNEYSSFNISTIDSFFQRIVRSFARELNIPGNYEVELDSDRVLEAAVTNFLDKLSRREAPDIFNWMMRFSEQRIEDGSGWDFRDELLELAKKVLNSETYRQHSEAIRKFTEDKQQLGEYVKMLERIQKDWRQKAVSLGERGRELLESHGVSAGDFKYNGSGSISYFEKLIDGDDDQPGKRFLDGIDKPDSLYKTTDLPQDFKDALLQLMKECQEHTMGTPYRDYMTACAIRSNFYELGILANVDKEVTAYCNENNIMLLSSTTEMLARLIDKDDAPFIYEKTGTRIHSYMIDEFQDTSGMQWGNFKPLLSNSLAEGYQNLIVGDVKQSIYRWRGGDWNLLNSEINDYEPAAHYDDSKALATNWRSLTNIIEFNNDFFRFFAEKLDEMIGSERIRSIYADVAQKIAPKNVGSDKPQGLVDISFVEATDEAGIIIDKPTRKQYEEEVKKRLPEVIIKLQENGFRPKDIAILCRRNKECIWAAEALLTYKKKHPECPYGMDIISSEALKIAARPTIQALIHLMRHLLNPESDIQRAIAWSEFFQLDGMTVEDSLERYFGLPDEERAFHPELAHRPLYEMTEELIALLPEAAKKSDEPFLQTFRDLVLEYTHSQSSDLSGFLEWWDQTGCKKAITTPEGQDAILILSVHKSKGLASPAVVIPYASWGMDLEPRADDILWCEPKEEPFKQDILLPVALKKDLEHTIFRDEYIEERERTVIDNLNTAYVAFTRAEEAMVIMAPKPTGGNKKKSSCLEDWLKKYCEQRGGEDGWSAGDWKRVKKAKKAQTEDDKQKPYHFEDVPQIQDIVEPLICPEDSENNVSLPKISILHDPEKPDVTAKEKGNYIHSVLQEIRTADEANQVIEDLYAKGTIDEEMISMSQMKETIDRILKMPEVAKWFKPGLQVLNELTLMDNQGNQVRPDRIVITPNRTAIVIDYKTGSLHPGYRRQVAGYMSLLQQLGYKAVKGYLLFIKDEKILEVRLKRS